MAGETRDDGRRLVLDHVRLRDASFSGRELDYFCAIASRFERCAFDSMRVSNMVFGGGPTDSIYLDCCFDGGRIVAASPGAARFERCSFRDVRFRELYSSKLEFVDCFFSGRIDKGYFNGAVPEDDRVELKRKLNAFRGNDFSAAELKDVDFRGGIDLSMQRLPQGPDYLVLAPDAAPAVAGVRSTVECLLDLELRAEALAVVQTLELTIRSGQRQLFIRTRGATTRSVRRGAELVYGLLRDHAVSAPV